MKRTRLAIGLAVGALAVLGPAGLASAHPLGNLTVNTSADVVVGVDRVAVDEVLDLAELPTVQARQRIDADGDGEVSAIEGDAYRASECAALRDGLTLAIGSLRLDLAVAATTLAFPPGQAGLSTLRLTCRLEAAHRLSGPAAVELTDRNLTDRLGWREVVLNGDGVTLQGADVPTTSAERVPDGLPHRRPRAATGPGRVRAGIAGRARTGRRAGGGRGHRGRDGSPSGPRDRRVDAGALEHRRRAPAWCGRRRARARRLPPARGPAQPGAGPRQDR